MLKASGTDKEAEVTILLDQRHRPEFVRSIWSRRKVLFRRDDWWGSFSAEPPDFCLRLSSPSLPLLALASPPLLRTREARPGQEDVKILLHMLTCSYLERQFEISPCHLIIWGGWEWWSWTTGKSHFDARLQGDSLLQEGVVPELNGGMCVKWYWSVWQHMFIWKKRSAPPGRQQSHRRDWSRWRDRGRRGR